MRHPARLLLSARFERFARLWVFRAPAAIRPQWLVTTEWAALGVLIAAFGLALTVASPRFGYAYEVGEMPVPALTAGLVIAGIVFWLALYPLVRRSLAMNAATVRVLAAIIFGVGLAARLVLFASDPILEDDYQRYLWDGAATASSINPYSHSPWDARQVGVQTPLGRLVREAGSVLPRINHPELKTIYPPVAQGAFALAHIAAPWSLAAWRGVVIAFDLGTLALILLLLNETGRSPLWSALYWWNPLVIKELANSAHMDVVVLPFVLGALLLAARKRETLAGISLAFAVGAKIWPVLLLPLILRPLAAHPRRMAGALLIFGALMALWAAPVILAELDQSSGFVAYFTQWHTNSALFPVLERAAAALLDGLGFSDVPAGLLARATITVTLGVLAGVLSLAPLKSVDDLVGRSSLLVGALVLLSPAQFPWYGVWLAPFLAFRPWIGFLILTATAPLYYMSFYYADLGQPEVFRFYIVWIIWVPVWAALALEAVQSRSRRPGV